MAALKRDPQWELLQQHLDQLIRSGQQGSARTLLLQTNFKQLHRDDSAHFADLARRLNMPKLMLQILRPIVRSEIVLRPPPSDRERALYATALSRLGVYDEAQDILDSLVGSSRPEVLLFQAQHSMLQWALEPAAASLTKYTVRADLSTYERRVGLVNLAACYVWNQQARLAGELLQKLLDDFKSEIESGQEQHKLIYSYIIELAAELAIQEKNYGKAQDLLTQAEALLANSQSRYEFYAKKWKAILGLLAQPHNPQHLTELRHIKSEGRKLAEWEVIRDCEFYEALALRDDELFLRVYLGTSHSSFRKRIKKMYQPDFAIPRAKVLRLDGDKKTGSRIFDFTKGCEQGGEKSLSQFPLLFRLLQILTEDLYRPAPIGSIASRLYPDEYFNPLSSPQKAHQVIFRLRQWLKENEIPLEISMLNENYQLDATGPYSIRVLRGQKKISKNEALMERVKSQFTGRPFNSQDMAKTLMLSPRSTQKFLSWAVKSKKILRLAAGRASRYRLARTISSR